MRRLLVLWRDDEKRREGVMGTVASDDGGVDSNGERWEMGLVCEGIMKRVVLWGYIYEEAGMGGIRVYDGNSEAEQ